MPTSNAASSRESKQVLLRPASNIYNHQNRLVRRALASLLVNIFSFWLIAPVVFVSAHPQLPLCCRRNGNHHCAMMGSVRSQGAPTLRCAAMRCPLYPKAARLSVTWNGVGIPTLLATVDKPNSSGAALTTKDFRQVVAVHLAANGTRGPPAGIS
jgi:hypothetical protein